MVNSKVIDMSDVFNCGGMAARIAQAKEKAEADYQEKVKQSHEGGCGCPGFLFRRRAG